MSESPPSIGSSCTTASRRERATSSVTSRMSNRRVGFIGMAGFRSDPVPADEWIPVRAALIMDHSHWSSAPNSINLGLGWAAGLRPGRWDLPPRLVYVPSGNRLRLVDLAARTVTTVFETPEPIESLGVPTFSSWSGGHPDEGTTHSGADETADPCIRSQSQRHQGLRHSHRSRPPEPGDLVRDRQRPGDR